jgi:integrase/recombinase XerC
MQQNLLQQFMNYLEAEKNVSPYTVRNYTHDLMDFFAYLREKKVTSLDGLDRQFVRGYLSQLVRQGIAKVSIARKLSAIRSFYRYLMREKLVTANPIANTSSPKLDKHLPDFLTADEIARLLAAPDPAKPLGQRDRAFMELLYASGLRVSELANLEMAQVDLESDEIRVWGKGSKERVVLMGKPAATALTFYLSGGRPALLGKKKSPSVFLNYEGGRLTERSVQRILSKYARAAGIARRVHPHMLRHTFATHLLDGGADLRVVQELLGHANLATTQIYTHVTQTQARKVYLAAHPLAKEIKNDHPE